MIDDAIDEVCDWLECEELDLKSPLRASIKRLLHARIAMLRYDDYVIKLLLAAGHITLEQVAQARAIADVVASVTQDTS